MKQAHQRTSRKSFSMNTRLLLLGLVFFLQSFASAQTFTVLHRFEQTDGANPSAGLIQDSYGNLYSTTEYGGTGDVGVLFKLSGTTINVLHSFDYTEAARSLWKPVRDSQGNLFGASYVGGLLGVCGYGCGAVYKVDPNGVESVIHLFEGKPNDGAYVTSGLVRDSQGNFYGTTKNGGTYNRGTVFKIDAAGNESILYSFKGGWDGSIPTSVIVGSSGVLYGTTAGGGGSSACRLMWTGRFDIDGCGTIWKLTNSNAKWTKTSLHRFNFSDGAAPQGWLIRDSNGNLYGTTTLGG
jgi:uncharacterized repeat protein (TIGR03803 family)